MDKQGVRVTFSKPALEDLGLGRVWQVASESRPGKYHYVVHVEAQPDGLPTLRCSCEGWQTHQRCWHVKQIGDELT